MCALGKSVVEASSMKSLRYFSSDTLWKRQQMPSIRIKEAHHNTKHLIDDIELNCEVLELKQKTAEKTSIPVEQQSKLISGDL